MSAPAAPAGYGAPGNPVGYGAAPGPGNPAGHRNEADYGNEAGYGGAAGNDAPPEYAPPPPGYGPPGGQAPSGFPHGQYQPGPSGPFTQRSSGLPPVNFDLNRLTNADKIVAVATLITMISLWLPWFSGKYSALGITSSATVSGTGVHGWLWLEFILALALLGYLAARAAWDRLPFNVPVAHERLLVVGTALQLLLIVIGFFAMPPTNGVQGLSIGWDFGAFLALIASIVAAAPVIYPVVKSYRDSRNAASAAQRY